jgi:diguanylate cyclase (GGDEF)-like protein/PAS domain S-box-containing protein
MLGYTKKSLPLVNRSWKEFIHPMDLELFEKVVKDYISKKSDRYKCEYRIKRKDNSYIWVSDVGAATWDDNGKPIRMVGSHTDITEQKKALEQIHRLAYNDDLTKLPNKFALQEQINKLCSNNNKFAVIFIGLDNFKSINDLFSYTIGDSVLKKLSFDLSPLTENDNCFFYRWAGDEFVLLLKDVDKEADLINYLDNLARLINKTMTIGENEIYISASVGACLYPRDGKSLEDLIKNSNAAKYHAKKSGKNMYKVYSPDLSVKVMEQITLERELRLALKRNEFQVYYQPRIDIKNNKIVGAEALLRWVKADGTIISPLKFIPKAEETGLIVPIGEFVIKSSCQQLKLWIDKGYSDLVISINLSVKQIEDSNLMNTISSVIKETGISPSNIEFEITESAAIKDLNETLKLLKALKEMGIKVLLDDFGTGYSSLNFLRLLPVTTIKIDKSFIDKVLEESMERTIVQSLISLAHSIKMSVIAEGIEEFSQLSFLQENLCDEAQGYYFSRPVPAEQFEKLLQDANK